MRTLIFCTSGIISTTMSLINTGLVIMRGRIEVKPKTPLSGDVEVMVGGQLAVIDIKDGGVAPSVAGKIILFY